MNSIKNISLPSFNFKFIVLLICLFLYILLTNHWKYIEGNISMLKAKMSEKKMKQLSEQKLEQRKKELEKKQFEDLTVNPLTNEVYDSSKWVDNFKQCIEILPKNRGMISATDRKKCNEYKIISRLKESRVKLTSQLQDVDALGVIVDSELE